MAFVNRVVLIVLDSVGCGDAPDVVEYGDEGSNTLKNTAEAVGGLNLPQLGQLGLGNTTEILGVPPTNKAMGAYGRLTEVSAGKDTTTGHWELSGVLLEKPFPVYPNGFPEELLAAFEDSIGCKTIGNYPASGTEIIEHLGPSHLATGRPIIYTSADSVFQIAAHESIISPEKLYDMCKIARNLLTGEHSVGRVIARPFIGKPGQFTRTEARKDFSLEPIGETILDATKKAGKAVMAVGKIDDIFAFRGITHSKHTGNNMAGINATIDFIRSDTEGLIFTNLVDFDAIFGHRNDPRGYANALEAFDTRLPEIMNSLKSTDILFITADHGNDPTTPSTDHSRERVPLLVAGKHVRPNTDIGSRDSFADLAATIAELLSIQWRGAGLSFAKDLLAG